MQHLENIVKKMIFVIGALVLAALPASARDVYVNGYYRNNGTYVQPYHRTSPNNTIYDNYSVIGNPWN